MRDIRWAFAASNYDYTCFVVLQVHFWTIPQHFNKNNTSKTIKALILFVSLTGVDPKRYEKCNSSALFLCKNYNILISDDINAWHP